MASEAASAEAQNAIRFLRTDIDAIDLQLVALLVQRDGVQIFLPVTAE